MGNKLSKPSIAKDETAQKSYKEEKQLGREIVDKIRLKTTSSDGERFLRFKDTKFAKRLEMDAQTEGTVNWSDIPNLFSQPPTNEARKLIQKYFKILSK